MNGARPHTDTPGYKYREPGMAGSDRGRRGGGAGQHQRLAAPEQSGLSPSPTPYLRAPAFKKALPTCPPGFGVGPKGKAFSSSRSLYFFPARMVLLHTGVFRGWGPPLSQPRGCFLYSFFLFFNIFPFTVKVLPSKRGAEVAGDRATANASRGGARRAGQRSAPHPPLRTATQKKYPSRAPRQWPGLLQHPRGDERAAGEGGAGSHRSLPGPHPTCRAARTACPRVTCNGGAPP